MARALGCKNICSSNAWNVNSNGNANNNDVDNANGVRPDSIKLRIVRVFLLCEAMETILIPWRNPKTNKNMQEYFGKY